MTLNERKTFVENPLDILKIIIPTLLILLVFTIIFAGFSQGTLGRKGIRLSPAGFVFMIFCIEIGLSLLFFAVLSLMKKITIICEINGCQIERVDFWGHKAETTAFLWNEINDTNLVAKRLPKGGTQLDFMVAAKNNQTRLMSRTLLNEKKFNELVETFNQSAEHLPYEWVKSDKPGKSPGLRHITWLLQSLKAMVIKFWIKPVGYPVFLEIFAVRLNVLFRNRYLAFDMR